MIQKLVGYIICFAGWGISLALVLVLVSDWWK